MQGLHVQVQSGPKLAAGLSGLFKLGSGRDQKQGTRARATTSGLQKSE